MLKRVSAFIRPPIFPESEDKTRKAAYAHAISLVFIGVVLFYELLLRYTRPGQYLSPADGVLFSLAILGLITRWLVRKGYVSVASITLVVLVWVGVNGIAASVYGVRDASFIMNFVIMVMAALLLGWPAAVTIAVASMATAYGLAQAEARGFLTVPDYSVKSFAQDISVVLGMAAVFISILTIGLENAIRRSQNSVEELEQANTELKKTQSNLQASAAELVSTNLVLQKRTERLRAIAEVARTAASVQDFDRLLPLISTIISKQLSCHRVSIFLVDQQREFAILRSQAVDGESRILTDEFRIKVGAQGMVGSVTRTGTPRIAGDRGPDTLESDAQDARVSHAELTLPLNVSGLVSGALDLQSTEPNAFDEEDVSNLTILADQVAISIQNALSAEQVRRALREAEIASRQATGQVWQLYTEAVERPGYRYDGIKSDALKEKNGSRAEDDGFFVPVQLRGQTIGRLKLKAYDASRQWTEDEVAIVAATAERVALALEGARLLEEAQKRASRESFLSGVAAKLGTSFQLDSILRDTVEELGQTLAGSTVSFQLVNPSAPPTAEDRGAGTAVAQRKKSE